jgi:hypothetical protein
MITKKTYMVVGSLLIVGTITLFASPFVCKDTAVKMLMPGVHKIILPTGNYSIWSFSRWQSKGIDVSEGDVRFKVANSRRILLLSFERNVLRQFRREGEQGHVVFSPFCNNLGRIETRFKMETFDKLTVSSDTKQVLVFVPEKLEGLWMDNDDFVGSSDDHNFVE